MFIYALISFALFVVVKSIIQLKRQQEQELEEIRAALLKDAKE